MQYPRKVPKNRKEDVDPEIDVAAYFEEDAQGRDEDGDDEGDDVGQTRITSAFRRCDGGISNGSHCYVE